MLKSINIDSSIPVYVQITNAVQFAIASGELKEGDSLPTIRGLADQLGVNPNTTLKAYRDLQGMKLVHSRRGQVSTTAKSSVAPCRDKVRRQVAARLHEVVSEAKASGLSQKLICEVVSKCHDFSAGLYTEAPKSIKAMLKE